MPRLFGVLVSSILVASALPSAAISATIVLDLPGSKPATRTEVSYECEGTEPFTVTYINGENNSLALVPVSGTTLVFSNVYSGSGARYAAKQYVWWTHQGQATLSDVREGETADDLTCKETG